jgi:4'-phosphopantetheinyl transferase
MSALAHDMDASSATRTALQVAFDRAWRLPEAAGRGVVLAFADLSDWRPWREEAAGLLSPAERERVQRKRRPIDQEELTLTYALHRLFLGAIRNLSPHEVPLARDAEGRPCLHGWAGGTSLSHASGAAAFVFSPSGAVGIDVESRARTAVMDELVAQVAHPAERAALPSGALRNEALLALWVRKEAFLKAAGVGLACEMDTFRATEGEVLDTGLAGAAVPQRVRLSAWDLHPGFQLALASPPDLPVQAQRL